MVGIAAGMRSIPFLAIGPWAGVIADRIDRRKMVLVVQSVMAVVVISFAVAIHLGHIVGTTGVIYALVFSFITGVLHSLIQPVRQAMVANTVPREDLWNAIALNSIAGNVARVVGPGLGGVLIAWLGPALNFYIEGVFYILMVLVMVPIALPYREAITATRTSMLANPEAGFQLCIERAVGAPTPAGGLHLGHPARAGHPLDAGDCHHGAGPWLPRSTASWCWLRESAV